MANNRSGQYNIQKKLWGCNMGKCIYAAPHGGSQPKPHSRKTSKPHAKTHSATTMSISPKAYKKQDSLLISTSKIKSEMESVRIPTQKL